MFVINVVVVVWFEGRENLLEGVICVVKFIRKL